MPTVADDAQDLAASLAAERQWPVTIKLVHPVQFGSEGVDELVFRRGKMADLKGMSLDGVPPVDRLLLIASRMCGKPINILEQLEDEDGAEVLAIALSFFARCLGAGKKV